MFNFQPQTLKPKKPGLLLAAIAGILMLVFSLVQAPSVHAIAYKDMLPSQQAKSWAYTNAVQWCIKNAQTSSYDLGAWGDQSRIKPEDASSGKWWQDSWNVQQGPEETVTSTYLHESANGDGVTTCNNVLREGAELWGYGTDFMSLMCDITGTRANGSSCRTGNGDFGNISGSSDIFRQKIKDKVYGGGDVAVDSKGLYWLYYAAFMKGCHAKATSIPAGQGNGDMIYRGVKTADEKGNVTAADYEGISKGEVKRVYVNHDLNGHTQNCGYIADRVSEYAASFGAWQREPANQNTPDTPAAITNNDENSQDGSASSCRVDGIGWIICPAVNFIADIVDKAYIFVEALLITPALNINTASPTNGTYITWSVMRNIANVAFVIAFMVIIYSQLTGVGVTNYGIKKLLPKLIVSAILVNVSYWICAIAVDISNVIGVSVTSLIDNITAKVPLPPSSVATTGGEVWGPLTATILASTTLVILGLTVLLPLLIAALAAIVTVLVVLVLRQALIVILIVVAPLAFVALLLPNTEDLFKRWRQLFQTLLLMFPIIAIIFAGSELASRTITASTYSSIGGGDEYNANLLLQVVGAGVAIIPLFITPIVMKTAGGLLNRFAGFVNNPNKGVFDRMRRGAEGYRKNRQEYRKLKAFNGVRSLPGASTLVRAGARRRAVLSNRERELKRSEAGYIADEAAKNGGFARSLAGGAGQDALQRAVDNAISIQANIKADEVKAANARIDRTVLELDQLRSVALGTGGTGRVGSIAAGDKSAQHAAIQQIVGAQDAQGIAQLIDNAHTFDAESQKILADSLMVKRPGFVGAGAVSQIRQGKPLNYRNLVRDAVDNGTYSPKKLAEIDKDEVAMVADEISTRAATDAAATKVKADATVAFSDPELGASKNRTNLDNIIGGRPGVY